MNKRLLALSTVALAVGLALVLAFPHSRFWLHGWLRGEAFYRGKPTSYWISAFKNEPFLGSRPRDVGKALAEDGRAAVPVLVEMLHDSDHEIHQQALLALMVIGPAAEEAVPVLEEVVRTEPNRMCLDGAVRLLLERDRRAAVEALMQALNSNPSPQGRAWAADYLRGMGAEAQAGVPALERALADDDLIVRMSAASALWHLQHQPDRIVSVLVEAIKSVKEDTIENARAQAGLPSAAEPGPVVAGSFGGPGPPRDKVTNTAIGLLVEMGPAGKGAFPPLFETLKDGRPEVRRRVALVLSLFGRGIRKSIPFLSKHYNRGTRGRVYEWRSCWVEARLGKRSNR